MTDHEITRLCADAIGTPVCTSVGTLGWVESLTGVYYRPLHDDTQAMALVKKFKLRIDRTRGIPEQWGVHSRQNYGDTVIRDDLNRAICECVAKMKQESK